MRRDLGQLPIVQNLPPGAVPMLILVGFVMLIALIRTKRARPARCAYRRKPLLTPWERDAFGTLVRQLRPGQHLCPQVRLADMLKIEAADQGTRRTGLNRVASKSVDFAVIDLASGDALLAIELDDRSHDREDRRGRDALVNGVLSEAGIPIVRFKPSQRLDIREQLDRITSRDLSTSSSIAAE